MVSRGQRSLLPPGAGRRPGNRSWNVPWPASLGLALAVLYRKRKDRAAEVAILERFVAQQHARGVVPGQLLERLEKLRGATPRE